jgi:hypothetical protein
MSTGLTFGSISALYGLNNGIINQDQYTILVTVVILSAVIPTLIAQKFFEPSSAEMNEWEKKRKRMKQMKNNKEQQPETLTALNTVPMEDTVTLHGQFSFHQSSCLLPIKEGRCKYEITVLEGKMRFCHSSLNPDGFTYTFPPGKKQPSRYDIAENQTQVIELEAFTNLGRLNQVEAVNISLRKPLKFHYKVTFSD